MRSTAKKSDPTRYKDATLWPPQHLESLWWSCFPHAGALCSSSPLFKRIYLFVTPPQEGKISRDRQVIISSVPDAASDSATGRSCELDLFLLTNRHCYSTVAAGKGQLGPVPLPAPKGPVAQSWHTPMQLGSGPAMCPRSHPDSLCSYPSI